MKHNLVFSGDKSITHRALICAALSKGITHIHGGLVSEDTMATLSALQHMGVHIKMDTTQDIWIIQGVGLHGLKPPVKPIDCQNSGTTMRLLAGVLVAQPFESVLIGDASLSKRPMARIVKPLKQMGAHIQDTSGHAPLKIQGHAKLKAISYVLPVASAQLKSCLLFAGLYVEGLMQLTETVMTRDHTERMLGIIKTSNPFRAIHIPGDFSSAAFFLALACLLPNVTLKVTEIGLNPTRTGFLDVLTEMGVNIRVCQNSSSVDIAEPIGSIELKTGPKPTLKKVFIDSNRLVRAIDEFPVICILAACAEGTTRIEGISELQYKESNRIEAMANGLEALGICCNLLEDAIEIHGGLIHSGCVDGLGDHRVAMAFHILNTVSKANIRILQDDCVGVSFPNFFNMLDVFQ